MATRLYETLGIASNATTDEIRKAYKKRALQTHPDRLAPSATSEDKARAAEQFRAVNNAYEVLSDLEKRRVYDLHGVYPPSPVEAPATERYPGGSGYPRGQPNSHYRSPPNPRFNGPSASFDPFGFTDPFDLFNQFFNEFHSDPFFANDPFFSPSFPGRRTHSLLDNFFPLIPGPSFALPPSNLSTGHGFSFSSSSRSIRNGPDNQWVSESYQTTTTKDGTLTIQERVDANGDKHVTKTYPDGTKSYRINGVKQAMPSGGRIADAEHHPEPYRQIPYTSGGPHASAWSNASTAGTSPPLSTQSRQSTHSRHSQHGDWNSSRNDHVNSVPPYERQRRRKY